MNVSKNIKTDAWHGARKYLVHVVNHNVAIKMQFTGRFEIHEGVWFETSKNSIDNPMIKDQLREDFRCE